MAKVIDKATITRIVSERVRKQMKRLELNQADLAATSGLTYQAVHTYVHGTREPTASALVKLARALECRIDYLVGSYDQPGRKLSR